MSMPGLPPHPTLRATFSPRGRRGRQADEGGAGFLPTLLFAIGLFLAAGASAQDWQAVERVEPYAVEGATGLDIYRSIGERGPKLGVARVIAHTGFKLTWTRKYERRGNACVIAVNRPKLVITYTLPKLKSKLSGPLKSRWDTFLSGVTAHEKVHGDFIVDMVREIEAMSVGMTVEDDPDCKRIRPQLQARLGELSDAQRARSREFDRVEMSEGGNVHRLILQLVDPR